LQVRPFESLAAEPLAEEVVCGTEVIASEEADGAGKLDRGQESEIAWRYAGDRWDVLTNAVTLLQTATAVALLLTSCSQQRRVTRLHIERLLLQ